MNSKTNGLTTTQVNSTGSAEIIGICDVLFGSTVQGELLVCFGDSWKQTDTVAVHFFEDGVLSLGPPLRTAH